MHIARRTNGEIHDQRRPNMVAGGIGNHRRIDGESIIALRELHGRHHRQQGTAVTHDERCNADINIVSGTRQLIATQVHEMEPGQIQQVLIDGFAETHIDRRNKEGLRRIRRLGIDNRRRECVRHNGERQRRGRGGIASCIGRDGSHRQRRASGRDRRRGDQ